MVVKYSGIRLLSNKVSLIIAALSVSLLYFRNTNNHRRKSYLKVMTASALILVIAAALLHAIWNLITKQVNGGLPFFWLISLFSAVLYLPFVLFQLSKEHIIFSNVLAGFALLSAVLHLLYFVVLLVGYRKADL